MSPFGTTAESRRRRATVLPRSMTNGCTRAVVAISVASSSASKRRSWLRPSSTASRPRLSASLTSRSWPAWSQAAASSSVWVARTTAAPSPAAARLAGRRLTSRCQPFIGMSNFPAAQLPYSGGPTTGSSRAGT